MMRKGKCKSCQDASLIIPINTAITAMYALALRYNYKFLLYQGGYKNAQENGKSYYWQPDGCINAGIYSCSVCSYVSKCW